MKKSKSKAIVKAKPKPKAAPKSKLKSKLKAKPVRVEKIVETPKPAEFHAENFPQLSSFTRGYLHEDYKEEHGSALGALDEFCYCANKRERDALKRDLDAFLKLAENKSFERVRNWWTDDLGSGWLPPDKKALLALQAQLNQADKEKKR